LSYFFVFILFVVGEVALVHNNFQWLVFWVAFLVWLMLVFAGWLWCLPQASLHITGLFGKLYVGTFLIN
jgi:hypothetical protein